MHQFASPQFPLSESLNGRYVSFPVFSLDNLTLSLLKPKLFMYMCGQPKSYIGKVIKVAIEVVNFEVLGHL